MFRQISKRIINSTGVYRRVHTDASKQFDDLHLSGNHQDAFKKFINLYPGSYYKHSCLSEVSKPFMESVDKILDEPTIKLEKMDTIYTSYLTNLIKVTEKCNYNDISIVDMIKKDYNTILYKHIYDSFDTYIGIKFVRPSGCHNELGIMMLRKYMIRLEIKSSHQIWIKILRLETQRMLFDGVINPETQFPYIINWIGQLSEE